MYTCGILFTVFKNQDKKQSNVRYLSIDEILYYRIRFYATAKKSIYRDKSQTVYIYTVIYR